MLVKFENPCISERATLGENEAKTNEAIYKETMHRAPGRTQIRSRANLS